eukprot:6212871-Pleurochrysis_carterae.AAC.4
MLLATESRICKHAARDRITHLQSCCQPPRLHVKASELFCSTIERLCSLSRADSSLIGTAPEGDAPASTTLCPFTSALSAYAFLLSEPSI